MEEDDLRCVVRPPARLTQVHPDPHAEDGAVAVAEHADGDEPVDEVAVLRKTEKGIKTVVSLPPSQKCVVVVDTRWLENANAGRHDVDDHGV